MPEVFVFVLYLHMPLATPCCLWRFVRYSSKILAGESPAERLGSRGGLLPITPWTQSSVSQEIPLTSSPEKTYYLRRISLPAPSSPGPSRVTALFRRIWKPSQPWSIRHPGQPGPALAQTVSPGARRRALRPARMPHSLCRDLEAVEESADREISAWWETCPLGGRRRCPSGLLRPDVKQPFASGARVWI